MKEKALLKNIILLLITLIISNTSYSADSNSCSIFKDNKCYYDAEKAVSYALNQVHSSEWNKFFPNYTDLGGNCTNFANQSILAGLVGSTSPKDLYNKGKFFSTDKSANSPNKWYFIGKNGNTFDLSHSWKGAKELKAYADSNANVKYKGMHFEFITRDSSSKSLEFSKIKKGDLMFADWTGDGNIDHTMIITNKTSNNYSGIYVTYQNASGYSEQKNIALSKINKTNTIFYVYRPTFYSDFGL